LEGALFGASREGLFFLYVEGEMSSGLLLKEVRGDRLVVAIDPGKVLNRVWLTTGERGLIGEPVSLPVLRDGVDELERLVARSGVDGPPVIGIEATGALHRAWAAEVERRWPGSLRLFAPSETQAARAQLGSRRFKTDDRDCAALVWLLRQGAGRPAGPSGVEALLGAVRHRRQLVDARRVAQQRLHDQLNALCPGLSAPVGHGRVLELADPSARAVLACAVAFAGRAPSVRSLVARAPGRLSDANARFWAQRWKRLLAPPADAELRAQRLGRDVDRWLGLREDIGDCPSFCVWGRGDVVVVVVVSRGSGLRSGSSGRRGARSRCGCAAIWRRRA
jgi:hypothetical protein